MAKTDDYAPATFVTVSADESNDNKTHDCVVRFHDDVTTHLIPKSTPEELEALFYTSEEIADFRHDAILEMSGFLPSSISPVGNTNKPKFDLCKAMTVRRASSVKLEKNIQSAEEVLQALRESPLYQQALMMDAEDTDTTTMDGTGPLNHRHRRPLRASAGDRRSERTKRSTNDNSGNGGVEQRVSPSPKSAPKRSSGTICVISPPPMNDASSSSDNDDEDGTKHVEISASSAVPRERRPSVRTRRNEVENQRPKRSSATRSTTVICAITTAS